MKLLSTILTSLLLLAGILTVTPANASETTSSANYLDAVGDAIFIYENQVLPIATTGETFNPGNIISDGEFYNKNSMTVEEIQQFLEKQNKNCEQNATCLKTYTSNTVPKDADAYCTQLEGSENETASSIIHRVANACNINPKVLLVMLQKEQGLIEATNPSPVAYERALGQACPDTGPNNSANCDSNYFGFFNQLYYGAKQFQIYTLNPEKFTYKSNQLNTIQWNPDEECGASEVLIENQATANLYNYTPYRPNVAALASLWDEGDNCSSYGNRNFHNYYQQWFTEKKPSPSVPCNTPSANDVIQTTQVIVSTEPKTVKLSPTPLCKAEIAQIPVNTPIVVTGYYGEWVQTKIKGIDGWVQTGTTPIVCAVPAVTASLTGQYTVVNTTEVNARKAPTTACNDETVKIPEGSIVNATKQYGDWLQVLTSDGKGYWIHKDYLELIPGTGTGATYGNDTYTTVTPLKFRTGPEETRPVLTTIPANTDVGKIYEAKNGWVKIKLSDSTGWVNSAFLTKSY